MPSCTKNDNMARATHVYSTIFSACPPNPLRIIAKILAAYDFAIGQGVDYLALSFVRGASDIKSARRLLRRRGSDLPLIAKIELRLAVENLDEILSVADGVMIARGDLGVEVPLELVPVLQKRILREGSGLWEPLRKGMNSM